MNKVYQNIEKINKNIQEYNPQARLVAVTKYTNNEKIMEAYNYGLRDFAENYVQRLVERSQEFPDDINWHMIGHIQSNKVKYLTRIKNLKMIHSIERIKIVKEFEKRLDKEVTGLLEINLSGEKSKSGISPEEVEAFFEKYLELNPNKLIIKGLMTISPLGAKESQKEEVFKKLEEIKKNINKKFPESRLFLIELSMGMTDDYVLALKNNSTIIRLGSAIFS
ncbi:MAG: YggS family pyridoxal phosphate-dependent enzyme [Candidatus Muiribacteriota bacterium]